MEQQQTALNGARSSSTLYTSESVSEGHPDKVADAIADAILDAYIAQDPDARVACEVACKDGHVTLLGEIGSAAHVDHELLVREIIRRIGYDRPEERFNADAVRVHDQLGLQSTNIAEGIMHSGELGAGDQGMMYGYATDETPERLPLPLVLAHRLMSALAGERKQRNLPWARPDAKAQVTVRYQGNDPVALHTVVLSTQHTADAHLDELRNWISSTFIPRELGPWWSNDIRVLVNPAGAFVTGGPEGDAGLTGRKIIVDTYGGIAHHGGGAFSGKDGTKVDRSAAYFARFVARQIVERGIARKAEVQVCYAIGHAQPLAVQVNTFGTGDQSAAEHLAMQFDYRPAAIIERLQLRTPLFLRTTNYGHFGKADLPWEN